MSDVQKRIDEMLNELKQERDELELKYSLAKLEANVEWIKLQEKLLKLEGKARKLQGATLEASQDIGSAAKLLGEEVRNGIKKIVKQL